MMKAKVIKLVNPGLRIAILVLTFAFAYLQILKKHDISQWLNLWHELRLSGMMQPFTVVIFILLIINILTESLKWKFLISKLEKVKLNLAVTAVLSGMAVSMFLPNRAGDYLGRVFVLQQASHIKAMLVTLIGSFSQFLASIMAGIVAGLYFAPDVIPFVNQYNLIYIGLWIVSIGIVGFLLTVYFHVGLLKILFSALFPRKKEWIMDYVGVFALYSSTDLLKILLFSFFRYFVFTTQFYLMLLVFDVHLHFLPAFMLIAVIYLLMMLIPTLTITELGIRGSVTLTVFGLYFEKAGLWNEQLSFSVLAASSMVWLINLAMPALLGALLSFRLRFFRKNIDHV